MASLSTIFNWAARIYMYISIAPSLNLIFQEKQPKMQAADAAKGRLFFRRFRKRLGMTNQRPRRRRKLINRRRRVNRATKANDNSDKTNYNQTLQNCGTNNGSNGGVQEQNPLMMMMGGGGDGGGESAKISELEAELIRLRNEMTMLLNVAQPQQEEVDEVEEEEVMEEEVQQEEDLQSDEAHLTMDESLSADAHYSNSTYEDYGYDESFEQEEEEEGDDQVEMETALEGEEMMMMTEPQEASLVPPPLPPRQQNFTPVRTNSVRRDHTTRLPSRSSVAEIFKAEREKIKLRPTTNNRSPGGTPNRRRRSTYAPVTTNDFIAQALQKKFKNVQPASPPPFDQSKMNDTVDWLNDTEKENGQNDHCNHYTTHSMGDLTGVTASRVYKERRDRNVRHSFTAPNLVDATDASGNRRQSYNNHGNAHGRSSFYY
eukprot:TRINITY_DN5609_c0_g1_i1.p1 TRINITY_DN5609_c0_g1~~TRINITY_DN5609_c0_g1_i1.p1  ORF type:complete len:430 (-),score=110.90 TRINITY_DN5609_c0_g1_i1:43-1332(-)